MKPKLVSILWKSALPAAASCVLAAAAHADVLYTYAGELVNEANVSLPGLGLSRDANATGTLYFKYTVTNPASNYLTETYFAGMQFYEGATERVGIGNAWTAWAYSAFNTASGDVDLNNPDPPTPPYVNKQVESTDVTTIVIRVGFNSGANDNITVWLNPNLSLTEAEQDPALTTNFTANATFDSIVLREGGGGDGWAFSDIAIAENATDAGFFATPVTTSTWDGGGIDSNWSTAANWVGDAAPAAGFDLIFPGSANTSPVNDFTAGTSFTGLEFAVGATSYSLSGNAIGISDFIRNSSASPQTIALPLELGGPLTLDCLNSSLRIDGAVSGADDLTKTGANRLELTADNGYTGNTTIAAGTLSIGDGDTTGSIDPTGAVSFGAGTASRLEIFRSDDVTIANPIETAGRANIAAQGGGKVNLSGPITGGGEFWTYGPGTVQITPNAGSASYANSVVVSIGTLEVADFTTSTLGTGGFYIGEAGSGTLRYTGPTVITDRIGPFALQGTGTSTFIEIANPASELTFTQPLDDNDPFGDKGLTKTGPGTLILAAAPIYGGDTVVEEGTLSLTQPGFADASTVIVSDGATLDLDFTGEDTVTGIVLGPDTMGPGTYNATSHPAYFTGTGSLVIPSTATPYETWGSTYGLTAGSEGGDLDNDGLTNFEEFAFGLIPNSGSSVDPIAVPLDKATGTFSYTRRTQSLTGLTYAVRSSTTLAAGGWTDLVKDTDYTESISTVGEVETVEVTLTGTLLTNPKLFIQVRAE